ncbi:SDR family oxidoreductase [Actinokineospora bangkokensis]|uniref:Oxidoreductase n=1 Tax=Actinokineospora bangkokensis TaxID=1193682 RepID=A0A1Q9LJ01_9PSEU|nr:SDR family oxidoreductase [Actinokineospora bangkokensis]OLR91974.1 oxidoreductase [Actinokineospora bangkokensis]
MSGKVVLITGASSGIGAATAERLVADGHRVHAAARRVQRIPAGTAHRLDVRDREAFAAVVEEVVSQEGRIDVLVNNAGVMPLSRLEAGLVDEWERMVDVNVKGVLWGIAAVLPRMRAQGGGHIVNVASIGAHQVVPTGAVYCATKYAVRALSDGLRQEVDDVRVTTISPGVVESELADSITDPEAKAGMGTYRATALPASAIAAAISYAVGQPEEVDVNEIVVRPTASAH